MDSYMVYIHVVGQQDIMKIMAELKTPYYDVSLFTSQKDVKIESL